MKKLILISIVIFFAICSKSWTGEIIMRCDNDDKKVYKWVGTTIGKGKVFLRKGADWIKYCEMRPDTSRIQVNMRGTIKDKGVHCKAILKGWGKNNEYFYDGITEAYLDFILLTRITNREYTSKDKSGNIDNIDKTENYYCETIN